jgi:putative acetyltransferase
MKVRDETGDDIRAIRQIVAAAFNQPAESELVDALRESGDAVISLVAEDAGQIVGHVLFSKLQAPDRCVALAPVSVTPHRQNQGIGSALIRKGLLRAEKEGWRAVFLLGEPEYYERFGFSVALADKFQTPYPKPYVMALELTPHALRQCAGDVIYAGPFLTL